MIERSDGRLYNNLDIFEICVFPVEVVRSTEFSIAYPGKDL